MANELQFPLGQSGLSTIAANLYLSGGARTLAAGAIAMSDTGTPGMYWGTVPSGLAAGSYTVSVYNSATLVGAGDLEWDGSQQITSDTLLTAITALDVAAMAAAVRAELATELARIDVATSTRSTLAAGAAMTLTGAYDAAKTAASATELANLATANQAEHDATQAAIAALPEPVTPPTAAANATAVRTELATELARIDVATSTRSTLTAAETAAAVMGATVESGATVVQSLRLANAVLGGKVSGGQTGTETFRDLADTKDVIVSTNDADGNRTAVVKNLG